jgi:two-component system, NtrC family, sensor kinase
LKRRSKSSGQPVKTRSRKTATSKQDKRAVAAKPGRPAPASVKDAAPATTNVHRQLAAVRDQLAATSDILRAIAVSPGEAEGALRKIAETTARLFNAVGVSFRIAEGDTFKLSVGVRQGAEQISSEFYADPAKRPTVSGRTLPASVVRENRQIHLPDLDRLDAEFADWPGPPVARRAGIRTVVGTPLRAGGGAIGALIVYRNVLQPFEPAELQLLQSFADQAVIAIENTRLLSELRESLEQQTATADVLKVISRSAFDLQAVFETLVKASAKLSGSDRTRAFIYRFDGELLRMAAVFNVSKELKEFVEQNQLRPGRHSGAARAALERRTIHIPDVLADPEYTFGAKAVETFRSLLAVPILKGDELLGVLLLYLLELEPFTDRQIAQVETFADQAAIAIENVRLFEAEQQRTRELTESLEQQTATSEVLRVISSSPGDLEPVFEIMLENAVRICDAKFGEIYRWDGDALHLAATYNTPPAFAEERRRSPTFRPNPKTLAGRVVATKTLVHIADLTLEEAYIEQRYPPYVAAVALGGVRTMLAVPILKENELIGMFTLCRQDVRPFADKQIDLVRNFASQAVIAIENTRLLTELRQRTDELAQRQAELNVTFDNMGDGVVMFNEEMRLAAWNRNLQEILDLPDSFFAEPRTSATT